MPRSSARAWAREATVDNDTFALLRAGSDRADAVAVICGAGINCVGRSANGRVARYPSLGWETGDWGGAEAVGREALFLAARAEDGRGEQTALVDVVRSHFGLPSAYAVGEAVHYRRLRDVRLGELAPAVVAAAGDGDAVARELVERLANEIVLMVRRAFADLGVGEADVVLGGGMLARGEGFLHERVVAGLPAGATRRRRRCAAGRGRRARGARRGRRDRRRQAARARGAACPLRFAASPMRTSSAARSQREIVELRPEACSAAPAAAASSRPIAPSPSRTRSSRARRS